MRTEDLRRQKLKRGLPDVQFFSAYRSDVEGGKEFKDPRVKPSIPLLLSEQPVPFKVWKSAVLDVLFIK